MHENYQVGSSSERLAFAEVPQQRHVAGSLAERELQRDRHDHDQAELDGEFFQVPGEVIGELGPPAVVVCGNQQVRSVDNEHPKVQGFACRVGDGAEVALLVGHDQAPVGDALARGGQAFGVTGACSVWRVEVAWLH